MSNKEDKEIITEANADRKLQEYFDDHKAVKIKNEASRTAEDLIETARETAVSLAHTAVVTAQKAAEVAYKTLNDNIKANQELKESIRELKESIEPMIKIYSIFDGAGTFAKYVFQWIVIPISVIIGIVLAWIKLVKAK